MGVMRAPADPPPHLTGATETPPARSGAADRCRDPPRRAAYAVGVDPVQYLMLNPRRDIASSGQAVMFDHGGEAVTRVVF